MSLTTSAAVNYYVKVHCYRKQPHCHHGNETSFDHKPQPSKAVTTSMGANAIINKSTQIVVMCRIGI